MNKLYPVLNWIKANPLIVVCIVIMLAGISTPAWLFSGQLNKIQKTVKERERTPGTLQNLLNNNRSVPTQDPNQPLVLDEAFTINAAAVEKLKQVYGEMTVSYDQFSKAILAFNRDGQPGHNNAHTPLVPDFFPKASGSLAYTFRERYKVAIRDLYQKLGPTTPPTPEDVAAVRTLPGAAANQAAIRRVAENEFNIISSAASAGQLYAVEPEFARLAGRSALPSNTNVLNTTTFHISPIAAMDDPRDPELLWEAQLGLWIQQDIVTAINLANNNLNQPTGNLLTNPVKALNSITISPRYLGMPQRAAANEGETAPPAANIDPNTRLPHNYLDSPYTGRISNPLFDIRPVTVVLTADTAQLPRILDAFTKVNLMTPIVINMEAVDQKQAYLEGHRLYGNAVNVARVTIYIETVWLRAWTAGDKLPSADEANPIDTSQYNLGLMPDAIRWKLYLQTRNPQYRPPSTLN